MQSRTVTHTVRSHGIAVARTHMYDWLILIALAVMIVVLNVIHPFYRFVGKDMMTDLKYPLKDSTVPLWAVPVSPLFIILGL
ncbi:putative phospholipid phosphatase [Helianthus annuus]|nr:putative phospholipid phosphatase [Helianthus annuus]